MSKNTTAMTELEQAQAEAESQIKAVYLDKVAEINGTSYTFTRFTHKERKKVFAFLSSVIVRGKDPVTRKMQESVRMDFWDEPRFEAVEELINSKITVDGVQLNKKSNFWDDDEYAADYIAFMLLAMQVISYPFMQGGSGK